VTATETTSAASVQRAPVGPAERKAWLAVVAATALLGVGGFVNSFERVNERMVPYFGHLAWTVPLSSDLGILIFTALDLLMAYRDIRSVWLRHVPRALVAVTIYLNVVGETALEGQVAHAVLPGVWVIAVEVAGIAVRSIFGLQTERKAMDRIRRSRWLLAPRTTLRLRRRMVLTEETNLTAALERDLTYELARADLRDRYGWLGLGWRFRAPRRTKLLLRRGAITPGGNPTLAPVPETNRETASETSGETGPAPQGRTRDHRRDLNGDRPRAITAATTGTTRTRAEGTKPTEVDLGELVAGIATRYQATGERLSRRALIDEVRAAGHRIGTKKATELLAEHTTATGSQESARTGEHTVAGFPSGQPARPHTPTPPGAAALVPIVGGQ
jgi:hypothetical protein